VPATTGAAVATTLALPQFKGKFEAVAVRGPIPVGSISDLVFITDRATSVDEVNGIFKEEAGTERYNEIVRAAEDEIVSSDIVGDPAATIVDTTLTRVSDGDLVKIMTWYDNEWGYSNQMVRVAKHLARSLVTA
jgi:Glyceraldehyde-3-phosphate dehydrogenase/erythrose-4-phosphate dehydrogenase